MSENNIQRRDVLKTVGAASALGVVGTAQGTKSDEGSVRLVELGIEYDLPGGHNYQRVHVEGNPLYRVDGDRVVLDSLASGEVRDTFANNDVVVNGVDATSIPSETTETQTVEAIPTALAAREDPRELTHLTESHRLPDVGVEVSGDDPIVVAEGVRQTLSPGSERVLELPPRTVSAETIHVTDETAEIEGVPEHMWGPKTEYGVVEVEAVSTVVVRDRGELDLRA
jgi:hypothetical protein